MADRNRFFAFNKEKNDDSLRKAARIQDFINKNKVSSRDLYNRNAEEAMGDSDHQAYSWLRKSLSTPNSRDIRYKEYNEMCTVPELNQGLNIYADNATQYDILNNVLSIESKNSKIIEILENLFFEKLDINSSIWNIAKNMCKMGDEFIEVIPDDKANPHHIIALKRIKKPENIERIEKRDQLVKFNYSKTQEDNTKIIEKTFQPWQIVHFKIDDDEFDPYGRSIFESGRKTYKRLALMEDAMLIYRISRAPEKRVFYIDVGNLSTKDANHYIEKLKMKFRKKSFVNPQCLDLETKIPLLDGRSETLSTLIKEFNEGKENWTYSIDRENGNKIVPGKIAWAGETRNNTETVKITLDDGQYFISTPDHKFILRDGSYCEAKDLKENDSLMPLYRKISDDTYKIKGYELVLDPSDNKYKYTHTISDFIMENEINKCKEKGQFVRHHIDFNKKNNNPSNIKILESQSHWKLHASLMSERSKKLWEDEDYRKMMSQLLSNRNIKNWKNLEYRKHISENNRKCQIELHKNNSELGKKWYENMKIYHTKEMIEKRNSSIIETYKNKIYSKKDREKFSSQIKKNWENIDKNKYKESMKKIGLKYGSIGAKLKNRYKFLKLDISYDVWKKTLTKEEYNNIISGIDDKIILEKSIIAKSRKELAQLLNCSEGKIANKFKQLGYSGWTEYKSTVNHRVVSIESFENRNTGTLTIFDYHNFAIGDGIFVKNSGEIDQKANPLAIDEDFFIPVRQNSQGTRIETLPAGQNLGEIDDVKYFRDQILKTMSIPAAYLGTGEQGGSFDSKSFLSQQDVQFARTIERIQKFIIKGLEKIAIEELIFNKIEKEELRKFKIKLTPPSNVDQLMEIEIRNQQFALIASIKSIGGGEIPFLPDEWIYENVLGMSEREINQIKLRNQMQIQMQTQMGQMFGGGDTSGGGNMDMGTVQGGNIAPTTAGGPEEVGGEVGGTEPITPAGGADLQVAGQSYIEFDGGKWLMENTKNVQKLLKYVQLYEEYNKDKNILKEQHNSVTRMAIEGEFRGLITAGTSLNSQKITLIESQKIKNMRKTKSD